MLWTLMLCVVSIYGKCMPETNGMDIVKCNDMEQYEQCLIAEIQVMEYVNIVYNHYMDKKLYKYYITSCDQYISCSCRVPYKYLNSIGSAKDGTYCENEDAYRECLESVFNLNEYNHIITKYMILNNITLSPNIQQQQPTIICDINRTRTNDNFCYPYTNQLSPSNSAFNELMFDATMIIICIILVGSYKKYTPNPEHTSETNQNPDIEANQKPDIEANQKLNIEPDRKIVDELE